MDEDTKKFIEDCAKIQYTHYDPSGKIDSVFFVDKRYKKHLMSKVVLEFAGFKLEDLQKILELTDEEKKTAIMIAQLRYHKQEMARLSGLLNESLKDG